MCPFHHEGPYKESAGARAQVDDLMAEEAAFRSEVTVTLGINA